MLINVARGVIFHQETEIAIIVNPNLLCECLCAVDLAFLPSHTCTHACGSVVLSTLKESTTCLFPSFTTWYCSPSTCPCEGVLQMQHRVVKGTAACVASYVFTGCIGLKLARTPSPKATKVSVLRVLLQCLLYHKAILHSNGVSTRNTFVR